MTISVYKVDSVIKAYNKQTRATLSLQTQNGVGVGEYYHDSVTLSSAPADKTATFEKISYNIRDLILKSAER